MSTDVVLRAEGLAKSFGGVEANRGVTLSVAVGEIRGLIGPNGAGKSTLCNLLCGIYPPSRGEVWLEGQLITGMRPNQISRRGLVRSFQVPRLFPEMTVADNLILPYLAQRGRGRRSTHHGEKRVTDLLEVVQLSDLRSLLAGQLSGGQQSLLQIAVGFMVDNVKCYVLDEPFAGINPVIEDTIIELVRTKNAEDRIAVILVSHEMNVVRQLCDSVSVLAEGAVLTEGTMDQVVADDRVIDAYLGRRQS